MNLQPTGDIGVGNGSPVPGGSDRKLRILHLVVNVGPTNTQLNEHVLPFGDEREITICSFLKPAISLPPGVVLFHGDRTLRGFRRALASALDQSPPFDVIHAHAPHTALALTLASVSRRKIMSRTVFTIHNSYRSYRRFNRWLMFPVFASFRAVVACGEAVLDSLPTTLRWVGHRKISVAPNGVDTDRVDRVLGNSERFRDTGDDFVVVSVGRLIPRKNVTTVIRAFARVRDASSRLVLVGGGEQQEPLEAEAAEAGLDGSVTFTGLVERNDVYRHIAESDTCISASLGEGLPVAVLEAMACGRPVILSDIPSHREIAGDEGILPLIRPDDVEGFSDELRRFQAMSRAARIELGERCRRLVEERFSLHAMHRAYAAVYQGVIDGSAPLPESPATSKKEFG